MLHLFKDFKTLDITRGKVHKVTVNALYSFGHFVSDKFSEHK